MEHVDLGAVYVQPGVAQRTRLQPVSRMFAELRVLPRCTQAAGGESLKSISPGQEKRTCLAELGMRIVAIGRLAMVERRALGEVAATGGLGGRTPEASACSAARSRGAESAACRSVAAPGVVGETLKHRVRHCRWRARGQAVTPRARSALTPAGQSGIGICPIAFTGGCNASKRAPREVGWGAGAETSWQ